MSRHRRRVLRHRWGREEEYVIRDVANAVIAALAYRRPGDGMIVVDVDETLSGRDRDDAIHAALLPFREGRLAGGPVALIAAAGEAVMRMGAGAQKSAVAVASAGTAAVLGLTTLVVTGAPEPGGHPAVVASTLRTVVAEPAPMVTLAWMPSPTVRASTPVRPSGSTPPEAGKEPSRRPAAPREASDGLDRTTPTPSARPRRTVEHRESEEPADTDPAPKTQQPAAEPTGEAVGREESREEEPRSPVDDLLPDVTVNTSPQPQPSAAGCGGIGVGVDLGKLGGVDVCLGKGG